MNKNEIWNRRIIPIMEIFASPYSVIRKIYLQLLMLSIVVYIIALIFVYYQHLDWISAIYAAVNVITTVGLYAPSIYSMPSQEKLFLTLSIVFSVGLFASMAQSLILTIVNRNTWIDARARWRGKHMRGHVVVLGNSRSVLSAVRKLEELDKDYVVVTNNQEIQKLLKGDKVILGDPKNEDNLISAGINNAESAIIAMDDDSETLLLTLKVQKINPPLTIVTVVKDSSMMDIMRTAGADIVIPFEEVLGRMMASASVSKQFAGMIYPTNSREFAIGVFEVKRVIKLKDLPNGVIPIAILKDGNLDPYFEKDTEVKEGEVLFVLGDPSKFKEVNKLVQ
ncbi:potassium transporter TrkA [Sulfolobus sp. B1]|uniref:potassium channel family protein n=1 Tax=Sulfolobaceae TaxID=118883 RepID=UPI0008460663|nr:MULTISPECIES: NAD-binding protein [unclassified Sulfolobus]TRM77091.1 potassium transporter TrkA [Sulfolobus sp. A20-N-F8]TRM81345.1 potassium transporter TrkA [Sulfolobus sp. D5]TRM87656.1 potassium transporter TrkA [Sulfolobus sp. C3]TRM93299.1 potassium transporter TrkA [Sulfolobus sp. A20-N-G8]TRN00679.1 potassium transporter TrkA [Sulfolobus sp. E1]